MCSTRASGSTDSDGNVPLRYQPYLTDPVGRFIGVELRKMF